MKAIDWGYAIGAILPRVEDPWPERIGLGFPFMTSGAAAVAAGAFLVEMRPARRDRIVSRFSQAGFWVGAALYLLSLLNQVASNL